MSEEGPLDILDGAFRPVDLEAESTCAHGVMATIVSD